MTIPTIASQLAIQYSSDGMIDLYKLDCSKLGGTIYYFSPQCYIDGSLIYFNSIPYTLMPIGIESAESNAANTNLPQPVLTISNASGFLMSAIVSLGDLVGSTLTYIRTKTSYLDGGANADPTKFINAGTWYIFQKTAHTNAMIQFALASPMDRPGLQFPIRQALKDPGINPGLPGNIVTAGSFALAVQYTIVTVGSTDFTLIGASANIIGVVFNATGPGTGTGTASVGIYFPGLTPYRLNASAP